MLHKGRATSVMDIAVRIAQRRYGVVVAMAPCFDRPDTLMPKALWPGRDTDNYIDRHPERLIGVYTKDLRKDKMWVQIKQDIEAWVASNARRPRPVRD